MNGTERLRRMLAQTLGNDERRPVALWRAIPEAPPCGSGFVRAVLETAEAFGTDLIKVPRPAMEVAPATRLADLARIVRLSASLNDAAVVVTVGPGDTGEWVRAAVEEAGCVGIYLPVEGADPALLGAANAGWCNILHLHGAEAPERWKESRPLWDAAPVMSWAGRGEGVSFTALRDRVGWDRCLMGGVDERGIARRTPDTVRADVTEALRAAGGAALILAPDCTPPPGTPAANLRAVQEAAAYRSDEHSRQP